jgi:hypothetical protein
MESTQLLTIDTKPDLPALLHDFRGCTDASAGLVIQQQTDYNTRFAFWDNQSASGKKTADDAKPWKNASDVRAFVADSIVNEQVKLIKAAWTHGQAQVTALDSATQFAALKVESLLTWLFKYQLRNDLRREVEIYAQFRQQFGLAGMGIYWEQQREVEPLEFDLFKLAAQLGVPPEGPEMLALKEQMMDPLNAPLLEQQFLTSFEGLRKAEAAQAVRDFRAMARCIIPRIRTTRSLPRWVAMRPYADLVFAPGIRDIQRTNRCYVREWLTPDELRDRAAMYDWDKKWIEKAIELRGSARSRYGEVFGYLVSLSPTNRLSTVTGGTDPRTRELVEVIHAYHRAPDKFGRMLRACTVFHPAIPDLAATHGPMPYQHGKWPFVMGAREKTDTAITESRGVPDIARHDQDVIKDETDARRDAGRLTIQPPLAKPLRRAGEVIRIAPAAQFTELNTGEVRPFPIPAAPNPSIEVEQSAYRRLAHYFGRPGPNADPALVGLHAQDLTDDVLCEFAEMTEMTVQLCQQYLDPVKAETIIGSAASVLFEGGREEIQGSFRFVITYDTRNHNMEATKMKVAGVKELLQLDRNGVIDFSGIAGTALSWIDPSLAQRFVKPEQAAMESEAKEEDDALVKIISGLEPAPPPENANANLRLDVLTKRTQANPVLQQLIQSRPDIQAMLEARVKQLTFITTQRQNAIIGRTGAESGLAQLQEAQPA